MSPQRLLPTVLSILILSAMPLVAEDNWCDRAGGGPAGSNIPVDLAGAHAGLRFFGVQVAYSVADQALVNAIDPPGALSAGVFPALQAYSESLAGVCVAPANTSTLGPAQVSTFGTIVLIRPGTGSVQIPSNADLVVVDLRDLPAVPGLRAALDAAVAPALGSPVARSDRTVRRHFGMTDEFFLQQNFYSTQLILQTQAAIPASWGNNGPGPALALATARRLAPEAAELAGTLRLARRAWIVGDDVFASVAESKWRGVGTMQETGSGLIYRVEDLLLAGPQGNRWPDVIPADILSSDPTGNLQDLRRILQGSGNPPHLNPGDALRPALQQITPFGATQPGGLRLGDIRGALIVSHGVLRLFYPYFPVVGDDIDPRLLETLGMLGSGPQVDAVVAFKAVRRFSEATRDGHYFWSSQYAPAKDFLQGALPVVLEQISGEPVVRKSNTSLVLPGDTLTSIAGVPAVDWFTQEYPFTSAATDGFRFVNAYRRGLGGIWQLTGPTEFGLRAPDGSTRTVTYNPVLGTQVPGIGFSERSEGPLSDMGAPDLYYLNLATTVIGSDLARVNAAVDQANSLGSAGMIIDGRNAHTVNHRGVAQRLICAPFKSMFFKVPVLSGPDVRTTFSRQDQLNPVNPYCGPMVLLESTTSISALEDFAEFLVGADRVIVVGRQTAGTNGNITGFYLPGGGLFPFTGMEVLTPSGGQFHGIGVIPDVTVEYTAADFATGRDRDLEVAIQVLHGQTP